MGPETTNDENDSAIFTPTVLPCGRTVANRLVKVAMYEHMATMSGGPPNAAHMLLYEQWAASDWGMIFTGNVQVSQHHLSLGRDIIVPSTITSTSLRPFIELARTIHGNRTSLAIMQLSHCGRQSANIIGGRWPFSPPLAPSNVPLELSTQRRWWSVLLSHLMFQRPREMSLVDVDVAVESFVRGARLAAQAGFDGVELHAAHGYLIAQFMSPESNTRMDAYSATKDPLHFLRRIVESIRVPGLVPEDFILGVKLNAADYVHKAAKGSDLAHDNEEEVLSQLREIARWRMVDFIEVSGGNYQNPDFMNHSSPSQSRREALFAQFSTRARAVLVEMEEQDPSFKRPLIILTGGMSSPEILCSALQHKHADLLGVGRLSVQHPDLPKILRNPKDLLMSRSPDPDKRKIPQTVAQRLEQSAAKLVASVWEAVPYAARPQFPKLIGAGTEMAWYIVAMREIAQSRSGTSYVGGGFLAILHMWLYVAPGSWTNDYTALVCTGILLVILSLILQSIFYP